MKFHWAAAAYPRWGSNKDVLFTDPYMVYKNTKHSKDALEFIKFLTNKTSMTSYSSGRRQLRYGNNCSVEYNGRKPLWEHPRCRLPAVPALRVLC